MKQLAQIIALNLFGINALQIIIAIGSAIMILQIAVSIISGSRGKSETGKRNRKMENDMWAIE